MIHALRTHAKRTLAAAFAAAFALGSALTLSACSGKPAKQTGSNSTLVPQTEVPTVSATATPAPEETASPTRPLLSTTRRTRPQHPYPLSANTRNPAKRSRLIFRQRTQPALSALRSTCRKAGRSEVTKVCTPIRLIPISVSICSGASCSMMKTAILPVRPDTAHTTRTIMPKTSRMKYIVLSFPDMLNLSTLKISIQQSITQQTA